MLIFDLSSLIFDLCQAASIEFVHDTAMYVEHIEVRKGRMWSSDL